MTKRLKISPHSEQWAHMFAKESRVLKTALGFLCEEVHHIGSTSIPDLWAKPIIDIILVTLDPKKCLSVLSSLGYVYKGEYNIPSHYGFSKRIETEVNLHVYERGHAEIELNIRFRDYLKAHPKERQAYSDLKKELILRPDSFEKTGGFFRGYTLGKYAFIQRILGKARFTRPRLLHCHHPEEWKVVNVLRRSPQGNRPLNGKSLHQGNTPMMWYSGGLIKGYGAFSLNEKMAEALIESMILLNRGAGSGDKTPYVELMEKWFKEKEVKRVIIRIPQTEAALWQGCGYKCIEQGIGDQDEAHRCFDKSVPCLFLRKDL